MTVTRGYVNPTAFRPGGDAAPSSSIPQQLWKRMTAEHETLSGGERDIRWLLDESSRLLALSRELQNHATALSRCLTELLKSLTPHASHDPEHDDLSESCRSSMALVDDAPPRDKAAAGGRERADVVLTR